MNGERDLCVGDQEAVGAGFGLAGLTAPVVVVPHDSRNASAADARPANLPTLVKTADDVVADMAHLCSVLEDYLGPIEATPSCDAGHREMLREAFDRVCQVASEHEAAAAGWLRVVGE